MRNRIAVFAGGFGGEFLQEALSGVIECCNKQDIDVFAFTNFTVYNADTETNGPEMNLFHLPTFEDFQGVIVFANSFNSPEAIPYILDSIKAAGIPAVSLEYEFEGMPYISTDNYSGMQELVEHLIEQHHVTDILYVGGPADHPENIERLKAVTDTLKKAGHELSDTHIIYSDWAKKQAPEQVMLWIEEHGRLPEAIVCANDIMAIAICDYLKDHGYFVPDDVIVTGYDGLSLGQVHIPVMTSVSHEWKTMGRLAGEALLRQLNGEEVEHKSTFKTKLVIGESCGCENQRASHKNHMEGSRIIASNPIGSIDVDSHFRHFYYSVRKVKSFLDLKNSFTSFFQNEHDIEGDEFRICLDPAFFDVENNNLRKEGYPDNFDIAVCLHKGVAVDMLTCNKKNAIFGQSTMCDMAGYYIFLPLYSDSYTYGFAVISGKFNIANDNQHYIWSRHINMALEQARSNILLDNLYRKVQAQSVTDALTGAYNRHGCEDFTYPALIEWGTSGGTCVGMLIDVDRMKNINDKFGHAAGDEALTTMTGVVKKLLPHDFQLSRFGGDEFFVGGILKDPDYDVEALIASIEEELARKVEALHIVYPLTISIGYTKFCPKSIADVEEGISIADSNMYRVKDVHHSRMTK